MNTNQTELCFLGSSNCTPERDGDTACLLLNDTYQFDTGWHSLQSMRLLGIDPLEIKTLFLTHCHHDHYLDLPALFYWHMRMNHRLDGMKIAGPKGEIKAVVDLAIEFLRETPKSIGYPELIELQGGDIYSDGSIEVKTVRTIHQVPTLAYRVSDGQTGKVVTISGDSSFSQDIVELARQSDALVHEAALGPREEFLKAYRKSLHSTVEDAIEVAREAAVGKLFLVHLDEHYAAPAIEIAKTLFDGEVYKPAVGSRYLL